MTTPTFTLPDPADRATVEEAALRALPWDGVVPLEQVLTCVLPAHGNSWAQALDTMLQEPSELANVTALAAEVACAPGMLFDQPVRVWFHEPGDWDADDEAEFGPRPIQPRVGNGMHRIAAAVLAGATQIRVTSATHHGEDTELVHVRAHLSGIADADDLFNAAADWLRSFRLTPTVWVETDGMFATGTAFEWYFSCPHHLAGDLTAALIARAGEHAMTTAVLEVTPTTWAQIEADDDAP